MGNARIVKAMRAVSNKRYHDQVTEKSFPQTGNTSLVENRSNTMDTFASVQKAKNSPSAKFFDSRNLARTREDIPQTVKNEKVLQKVSVSEENSQEDSQRRPVPGS